MRKAKEDHEGDSKWHGKKLSPRLIIYVDAAITQDSGWRKRTSVPGRGTEGGTSLSIAERSQLRQETPVAFRRLPTPVHTNRGPNAGGPCRRPRPTREPWHQHVSLTLRRVQLLRWGSEWPWPWESPLFLSPNTEQSAINYPGNYS